MSRPIRRTRQVHDDLVAIYAHVAARRPAAAENVLNAIERTIRLLADLPGMGTWWRSPDPRLAGMRVAVVTPYRNYLVFFRKAADDCVEVFRVAHGAQQLDRIVDEIELDFEDE